MLYFCTWNPNDPCFDWGGPCFGGLNHQNSGQTGSRYIIPYHKNSPPLQMNSHTVGWYQSLYFMNFMNECFQENHDQHRHYERQKSHLPSGVQNRPSKFHYVPPSKPQWRTSSELQNWTPNTGRSGETRIPIINVKNKKTPWQFLNLFRDDAKHGPCDILL